MATETVTKKRVITLSIEEVENIVAEKYEISVDDDAAKFNWECVRIGRRYSPVELVVKAEQTNENWLAEQTKESDE